MKYAKYFIVALALLATTACQKDTPVDQQVGEQRDSFLAATEIGVYQNGSSALRFDRTSYQLAMSPDRFLFRIMDNTGTQYAQLKLDAQPSEGSGVNGEMTVAGFQVSAFTASDVRLLKREGELVWLWSDGARTGMIMPWIEL